MCCWADVSVSGFYSWRRHQRKQIPRKVVIDSAVKRVFEHSNSTYGYRRIFKQLQAENVRCSERDVRSSIDRQNLVSCHPEPWRYKTQPGPGTAPADLIRQKFWASRPGIRFVGDITQIDTWEGPLYLSTMIDLFNGEVAGWAMADNYHTDLVCETISMAKRNRRIRRRAIFHSDRGSQYTSNQLRLHLETLRMRGSMGRVGTCYDNALAESFFASLKKELVNRTVFPTRNHARKAIANYIEVWYNRQRLHSSHGYRPPSEVRETFNRKTAA
jgi:putative transposase